MLPVLPRAERRRIEKIIHKTKDKEHARRLTAILMLHQGHTILSVHRLTAAARSSIQRWLSWYQECGISGAYSGAIRTPIPALPGQSFRDKPDTDSAINQPF